MRSSALLALLLLAACSATPAPLADRSPQERACETQADQDPAVRQTLGIAAGNLNWQWQHTSEINQAKRDAVTRCLRARGLAPRGGVEKPR